VLCKHEVRPVLEDHTQHPPTVMVWGGISYFGKSKIHIFKQKQTIDSTAYCNAALSSYFEAANRLHPHFFQYYTADVEHPFATNEQYTFMHDNASVHASQETREQFYLMCVNVAKNWPAVSPDLNPIENVWSWMAGKISKHAPHTRQHLIELIKLYWDAIDVSMRRNLFISVPVRLIKCLANCGHSIKY
jgi:hypothetical protein